MGHRVGREAPSCPCGVGGGLVRGRIPERQATSCSCAATIGFMYRCMWDTLRCEGRGVRGPHHLRLDVPVQRGWAGTWTYEVHRTSHVALESLWNPERAVPGPEEGRPQPAMGALANPGPPTGPGGLFGARDWSKHRA
jgi:hypothetical protein